MVKINYLYGLLALLVFSACNRPVAKFTVKDPEDHAAPAEFEFINESKKAVFYKWEFGDEDSSFHESPSHIYYKPGTYVVTLHSINENKSNTKTKNIIVTAPKVKMIEIQTPYGNMIAELYDDTPLHRDNFLKLISEGFYEDLLFHRVIDGFMVQGGDPESRDAPPGQPLGSGGPGYQIDAEIDSGHKHTKGALAAARMGDAVNPEKKSSGSQFYIVHGDKISEKELTSFSRRNGLEYDENEVKAYAEKGGTPFLDGQYTVFGQIVKGLDVIDRIAAARTGRGDRPVEDIKMNIVEIK